ncbi:2TM domain-containing protein [Aquabacterium sp. A7-Y]|uniref:2TM domain-containing protein n=1 Tax=Aquabacterium sp. A7-Y TaxID=1349605 RepID=UPI00223DB7F0|nr:2TM domain-containing protein [Aquabacterium sp. A7-Y]MCW7539281.1 2TM domain-containing protein [Aquabacterium sp. A7-Y]
MTADLASPAALHKTARRRVAMKLRLAVHSLVFVLVNAGLWLLNELNGGPRWAVWPLGGWGLGLAIHATVVILKLSLNGWTGTLVEREIERLARRSR